MMHIACAAITRRIFLGRVNKAGDSFVGEKRDVTSECLQAIIDKVGVGCIDVVNVDGKPAFEIEVRAIAPALAETAAAPRLDRKG